MNTTADVCRLKVLRADGSVLGVWEESENGTGRIVLRLYREGGAVKGEVGPPRFQMVLDTLEVLELCSAGRVCRDMEVKRMKAGADSLFSWDMVFRADEADVAGTVDFEPWMAGIRKKTLEWMGRNASGGQSPSALAMAFACSGVAAAMGAYPMTFLGVSECLDYLAYVPEARDRLHVVAALSPEWERIVSVWPKIEAMANRGDGDGVQRELERAERG